MRRNFLLRALTPLAVALGLWVTHVRADESSVRLCSDGKAPLLEGGENQEFPCTGQCPDGFRCELADSAEGGICCPDLNQLIKLYGDDTQQSSSNGSQAPSQASNPDKALLSVIRLYDVRRSVSGVSSFAAQSRAPDAKLYHETKEGAVLSIPDVQKTGRKRELLVDPTSPGFSCRRQKFEPFCPKGNKRTQRVLRWYAYDGVCRAYPWGFCPGSTVSSDRTLRSKAECEELCLHAGFSREKVRDDASDVVDNEARGGLSKVLPPGYNPVRQTDFPQSVPQQSRDGSFVYLLEDRLPQRKRTCTKVRPYRTVCPNSGIPSQFTIRWHAQGGLCRAYPYGYCSSDAAADEEPVKTKEECQKYCFQA